MVLGLRVPRTARKSNQSILKEISPGCSLEGLMLKPKLQYFGHLIRRADSLEKTLMLGKIEGRRRRGRQRMRCLDAISDLMGITLSKLWELMMDRKPWPAAVHRVAKSQTRLGNWTELKWIGWKIKFVCMCVCVYLTSSLLYIYILYLIIHYWTAVFTMNICTIKYNFNLK